jgi:hypothetical protein
VHDHQERHDRRRGGRHQQDVHAVGREPVLLDALARLHELDARPERRRRPRGRGQRRLEKQHEDERDGEENGGWEKRGNEAIVTRTSGKREREHEL